MAVEPLCVKSRRTSELQGTNERYYKYAKPFQLSVEVDYKSALVVANTSYFGNNFFRQ